MRWVQTIVIALCLPVSQITQAWTPIIVKSVTTLGPQLNPEVTNVSRDGGYSALIDGNIVWLYDDTECMDSEGGQLSFISNTASYQKLNTDNLSTVTDFGVVGMGQDQKGNTKTAILAGTTVGTGAWIPFQPDELDFNKQMNGKERVAIWPGTSPTSISTTQAFLYAPLVYVDSKPSDPSKEYQARGMTLITITAPDSGPIAARQGDLIIPGTEVAFGGFSTLLGYKSRNSRTDLDDGDRDVYLLGMTNHGLQLARAGINDLTNFPKYTFWNPEGHNFSTRPPNPGIINKNQIYMPGTFSSGSIFYSPYFQTFVMVYFNKMVDSTFYIRYLQLNVPLGGDPIWVAGGLNGKGIRAEDVEALVKYVWSAEQILYASPPGPGGFNYAGMAHPEFFNTQYYPQSLYSANISPKQRTNAWYGPIPRKAAGGDGRNLLLSWTSQKVGGTDSGIYGIQLAMVAFDNIPPNPDGGWTPTSSTLATPTEDEPISSLVAMVLKGSASHAFNFETASCWLTLLLILHSLVFAHIRIRVM